MKRRIAALLAVLAITSIMLVAQGQTTQQQRKRRDVSFELGRYGTLLNIKVNGQNYGTRPLHEGYGIGYRVGVDERYVYAFADQAANELSPDESSGQPTNSRVTTTKDGVWRVTSRFSFNDRTGWVTIQRKFENVSPAPVQFLMMKSQLDDNLAGFKAEQIVRRARSRGARREITIPIRTWVVGGTENECIDGPCDPPPYPPGGGCCGTCPTCTEWPQGLSTRAVRLSVLFCRSEELEAEINNIRIGNSLAMDQIQGPFGVTLYLKAGTNAVTRWLPPKGSATSNVQIRLQP